MSKKGNPLCEPAILRNQDPQSTPAILRNHVLYQKSYVQEELSLLPKRCPSKSPVRHRPNQISKSNKKIVTTQKPEKKQSSSASPVRARARNSFEQLEHRRLQRKDRERPWLEKSPKMKTNNGTLKLFYDRTLPACVDKTKVTLRARKYVANSKYGNIYEIREEPAKCRKATKSPQPRKWIWEDEFLLWMKGSREKYMEEIGSSRTKQNLSSLNDGSQGSTNTNTPRPGSLPSIREPVRPSADVYA